MLEAGVMAPEFSLKGVDGNMHTLHEFRGRVLVLYFYPRDNTPGCTIEAKEFTQSLPEIRELGADVVGISDDDYDSHCKFRDKHGLKVLLLSDPDKATIKAYEAWGSKGIFGVGTLRKTFIIDQSGSIVKEYGKVNALGHANEVIKFLKTIKGVE